jgi:superfamily I DNA/RNA helicase
MTVQLTAEQTTLSEHPIAHGGPAVNVAVAGSGKTESVVATVKNMIAGGVSARDIAVATFSRAGCEAMSDRAARRAVPNGVSWRTLHSMGYAILGEISHMGRERPDRRDLVVCDPGMRSGGDTAKAWWVRKLLRDYLETRQVGQDAETCERIAKLSGTVLGEISGASAYLIWPDAWTAQDGTVFPGYIDWATAREREPVDDFTADIVEGFYSLWEAVKTEPESHGFDAPKGRGLARPLHPATSSPRRAPRRLVKWISYDDMLAWPARWILEGRGWMECFRGAFAWLVVDEAQDNNLAQNVLAEHIAKHTDAGPNLILVGDDMQSIFGFRGAQPTLLRGFLERWDARLLTFTNNFRCAQSILDAGNNILGHATDRLYDGDLLLGRTDDAAKIGTVTAEGYEDGTTEAAAVVDGIIEAIEHGVSPDEIAVLYRLNAQSGAVELECIKRGILYRVEGSRFFRRAEVRAVLSVLALALDASDEGAWNSARCLVRGLGAGFAKNYPTLTSARKVAKKRSLYKGWREGLDALLPILDGAKAVLDSDGLSAAIDFIAEDGGVRAKYRDDSASEEDETEVDTALRGLAECAENLDVEALLAYASDQDTGTGARDSKPRITLSTIHKSKGLEWSYVAAIGWTAGVFPFFRAPLAEERRLGYVCVTRAKQYLHISWTRLDTRGEVAGPSSLVAETKAVVVADNSAAPVWPGVVAEPEGEAIDWGQSMGDR